MFRGRRIVIDDSSSDEEFPDVRDLLTSKPKRSNDNHKSEVVATPVRQAKESSTAKNGGTVRRRKLGTVVVDNPLLRPIGSGRSSSESIVRPGKDYEDRDDVLRNNDKEKKNNKSTTPQRVELRTRKTKPVVASVELDENALSETDSVQEGTILEEFSEGDEDEGSDFEASQDGDSDDDDFTAEFFRSRSPSKSTRAGGRNSSEREGEQKKAKRSPSPGAQLLAEAMEAHEREKKKPTSFFPGSGRATGKVKNDASRNRGDAVSDLADPLSKLRIHELPPLTKSRSPSETMERPSTPPSPPLLSKPKGLVSPSKKLSRIPATPHRPHMDTFWDQEFIDEWNDEHSPKKQLLPPTAAKPPQSDNDSNNNSPNKKKASKSSSSSSPQKSKSKTSEAAAQRAAKKAFAQAKHEAAERFLRELDERVAEGRLSALAASTGGIRIEWSNKLNTTAGRANWKRETIRSKTAAAAVETPPMSSSTAAAATTTPEPAAVQYRHHASIELAEKVIDDEHRLLNVIAHEFCHLATFMITGVTNNPHGKEFKGWAAKVTRILGGEGGRGIEVTTKHSYDIAFKYVWECTACGTEFKRHSKSIHPDRHRCGLCKSVLRQTKPVPRGGGDGKEGGSEEGGSGKKEKKESDYQRFMKEQMKVIREENPGCPPKDIMRMVASRWAAAKDSKTATTTTTTTNKAKEPPEGEGEVTAAHNKNRDDNLGSNGNGGNGTGGGPAKKTTTTTMVKELRIIDLT